MLSNTQKIVTILACSVFLSACVNKQSSETQVNQKDVPQEEQGLKGKYSIKSLLAQNKNLTCTYKFTDEENKLEITGKAYVTGKKVLQQTQTMKTEGDKMVINGNVYTDGEYVYIWSPENKASAMKMKVENQAVEEGNVKTDVAGAQENMEKEYDLDCMPWKVDEKILTLPADINFKDFSTLFKP